MTTIAKRMEKMRYEEPAPKFSRSERETLVLLLEGLSNKEMAERRHRSIKTIEITMTRISSKLQPHLGDIRSRVKIALWIARHPESIGLPPAPLLRELVKFVCDYQTARVAGQYTELDEVADDIVKRARSIVA